ncbi:ATP-binding cassette domain-containing protein [Aurantimonas sp. Leaf443]|uniref:ATP-binding cassette domain-containing protein n=1 Tax=Aurantimonas sp. Leaf443 TaxID=1736378 RepID=UPI000AE8C8CD|nr:ATP-binding cassette domain-containing protein [Aurantimonas sp. Leaf443]
MSRPSELDESIFTYVWRNTRRQQIWLFVVLLVSLPLYYLTLDLPKKIVNGPIQGEWAAGQTHTYFAFAPTLPTWLGGATLPIFDGLDLDRIGALVALSLTFLFFVIVNGLFKFYLSNYKGQLGERLLRRLRYDLVDRVLRFPTGRFKQIRGSEVASMIKDETEPVGGFGGSAFADPALLLSQALTALTFIVLQNAWLGAVAGGMVLIQLILIPQMRRRLVVLARARQLTARLLSGRIGEICESIPSIRTNDTTNWERAELGDRLGKILWIRYDFFRWKFFTNFVNNLIAQVTPFIFYLGGGYLVIIGKLDIGQLVAVIAAYKDLPAPLKELITWDQFRVDVQSKYAQIREQFVVRGILDSALQAPLEKAPKHIEHEVQVTALRLSDDSGNDLLEATSLRILPGETIGVRGAIGAGGEHLAEALARLIEPTAGRIALDGVPYESLPESMTGRRIAYSQSGLYLAQMSIGDALLYGLKHVPVRRETREGRAEAVRLLEARAAGNIELDIRDDWVDYEAAGVDGPDALLARVQEVLEIVDLRRDVARLGLRNRLPDALDESVAERILKARRRFRERLNEAGEEDYFEPFDPLGYSNYASVLENLVFGVAPAETPDGKPLVSHPQIVKVLADSGLDSRLVAMGRQIAETLVEIFGDLTPDNPLLENVDLMAPDEVEQYKGLLRKAQAGELSTKERMSFQKLAFRYIEPRHRLGLLDDDLRRSVLQGRAEFHKSLNGELAEVVFVHSPDRLNPAASLQDNVMFGRVVDIYADAARHINDELIATLREFGLADTVFEIGLDFDIGSGAKRLSSAQQQKLALARALLKRADLLILNRPLSALDLESQHAAMERVIASREALDVPNQAIFWVVSHPEHADLFDRVLEFHEGRLVEPAPVADTEPTNTA